MTTQFIPRTWLIVGLPRTGKTQLSQVLALNGGLSVFHTDEIIGTKTYLEQANEVCRLLDKGEYDIYEGCAVVLGALEWLERHNEGAPCDLCISLTNDPFEELEPSAFRFQQYLEPRLTTLERKLQRRRVRVLTNQRD